MSRIIKKIFKNYLKNILIYFLEMLDKSKIQCYNLGGGRELDVYRVVYIIIYY